MDILGPQGVISKHTSDQLARLWPAPQDAEKAAHRAKTVRDTLRIVEAVHVSAYCSCWSGLFLPTCSSWAEILPRNTSLRYAP